MMRIILTQGETIHEQLKRLQERDGQIDDFEGQVHENRTKSAGKDYLLKAYLEEQQNSSEEEKKKRKKKSSSGGHQLLEALKGLYELNERLTLAEVKADSLEENLRLSKAGDDDLEVTRVEVTKLREVNERIDKEIESNRELMTAMRTAAAERRAFVSRLEADMGHEEVKGDRLQCQLKRVINEQQQIDKEMESNRELMTAMRTVAAERRAFVSRLEADMGHEEVEGDRPQFQLKRVINEQPQQQPPILVEDEDEEFLDDLMLTDFRLSASQLYENCPIEPQMVKLQPPRSASSSSRLNSTGSPGSSSGCGTGSENGTANNRDASVSTPDLPPLPPEFYLPLAKSSKKKCPAAASSMTSARASFAKSILKSIDPSGDLDSNSDTGLSSLHSSSDEGTYVLDTLV